MNATSSPDLMHHHRPNRRILRQVVVAALVVLLAASLGAAEPNAADRKQAEELSLPWGGKLSLNWPAQLQPVRTEPTRQGELRWEDAGKGWTAALSLLAPPQAGFTLAAVKENTLALVVKGGLSTTSARDETLDGRAFAVLTMPALAPHRLREWWMTETAEGVVGVFFISTADDPDAGRLTARSVVKAMRWPARRAPLTEQQMRDDLRQLARAAGSAWAWKEMRREKSGVNLDAVEQRLAARIHAQTTPEEFGRLLKEFAAAMQDGHASLGTDLVAEPVHRLPFECREADEGIIVSSVGEGAQSLARGDRLLVIGGVAVADLIADRLTRMPASTEHARRYQVIRNLPLVSDAKAVVVEVEKIGGGKASATLSPTAGARPVADELSHRRLADNLGYIRLASFAQDTAIWEKGGRSIESLRAGLEAKFQKVRDAFADLHDSPALILDVRDNGGGSDLLGQFVARAFAPEAKKYYDLATHVSPELLALPEFAPLKSFKDTAPPRSPIVFQDTPNPPQPFGGKLYVLMNEGCFSATDCFLNFIACARPDAVLAGMPNGAGAGAPREIIRLAHSGARLTCCVMRVWNLRGEFIEGNALKPTIRVRASRGDIAAGHDAELDAAINDFKTNKP